MNRPLSARRRIHGSTREWSPGVQEFLQAKLELDRLAKDELDYQLEEQRARQTRQVLEPRSRYEVSRKAFQVAQRHKAAMARKYQTQVERTQSQTRKAEDAARPRDLSRTPVKKVHDRHVLEHVIACRNDEYMEASEYVPKGYVANIDAMRRLPPDRKFHANDGKRVYYWG